MGACIEPKAVVDTTPYPGSWSPGSDCSGDVVEKSDERM